MTLHWFLLELVGAVEVEFVTHVECSSFLGSVFVEGVTRLIVLIVSGILSGFPGAVGAEFRV